MATAIIAIRPLLFVAIPQPPHRAEVEGEAARRSVWSVICFFVPAIVRIEDQGHPAQETSPAAALPEASTGGE